MKAKAIAGLASELLALPDKQGYYTPEGDFDQTKLNDIKSDLVFVKAIEDVLTKYGVHTPTRVAQIIDILPLVAQVVK